MTQFQTCKPSQMTKAEFVETFADIYEHSPWVAERTFDLGLNERSDSIETLHAAMSKVMLDATPKEQLDLINAHPDLAGKAAVNGELTAASTSEQAGAGISQCSAEEFAQFTDFNERYKARFQFPFIMAVKGANRHQILASFAERIDNDSDTEFATAIAQINKIALFRLQSM
ncbi:2-oxo-4-hydroxy-4-carboxy-5-ureidoimidazoline decarboxylase [Vibrio rumoiensis]|uniref:2-oxo-4-hydroxy-4-carboxy-5-ureidoimidazoline decarboxylase n=1 Tax=Vibrio rumoiensis 1S-45 TaxID=1188252 RepID=A0A1E5E6W3_9VIBR|nr:2-oxo-4-hydroxy-4-carboxy-5-ureidoimidazoline decarboxylase [Vibrio rumoiensis]OEF30204.1 OHCU decarboxylase [Vibrio rumoiensis 1S-45]